MSKRTLLAVFCNLMVMNNEEEEVWNIKSMYPGQKNCFSSNPRICYDPLLPIRSLEMTMEYVGVSVCFTKESKQSCGKMPNTTILSKCAMQ